MARNVTPLKRISKRRYPPRICKKTECSREFIPVDARQWYCSVQHRVDHNNDLRKVKQARFVELNQKLTQNEIALEKGFLSLIKLNQETINMHVLQYDGFDLYTFNTITMNTSTGKQIYWSLGYGIEGSNADKNSFIIHKNKNY